MKQVFVHLEHGAVEVLDVPAPVLVHGTILVRTIYSAISSGTEKSIISLAKKNVIEKALSRPEDVKKVFTKLRDEGLHSITARALNRLHSHFPLGYSAVGEVIECAPDITHISRGDYVGCFGAGYANHAEVIISPKNLCVPIPGGVSHEEASLVALGAIALEGIRRAEISHGESVAVIGLGIIGQLTLQMLNAYGHHTYGVDQIQERIVQARTSGYNASNISEITEHEFDAIIITAASTSSDLMESVGTIARNRGRIIIVGDVRVEIPRKLYYKKELKVFFSRSCGPGRYDPLYEIQGVDYPISYVRWTQKRNAEEFLRLLHEKRISLKSFTTATYPVADAAQVYERLFHDTSILTALFTYQNTFSPLNHDIRFPESLHRQQKSSDIAVGIIGVGTFAREKLMPILKHEGIPIRALSLRSPNYIRQIVEKYKPTCVTSDYRTIINDAVVNLVLITTPHHLHAQYLLEALEAGKNVYLEKPLCRKIFELQKIVLWFQKNTHHPSLFIGFNRRYAPLVQKIKATFASQSRLSIIYRVNNTGIPRDHWLHDPVIGGGRIIGQMCHMIDTLHFLTDSRAKAVSATALPSRGPYEGDVHVTIEFENGSIATIIDTVQGSPAAPKEYIEIYGGDSTAFLSDFKRLDVFQGFKKRKSYTMPQNKGHSEELKTYCNSLRNGEASPQSLDSIFLTSLTTFKILDALRTHARENIFLSDMISLSHE